MGDNDELNKALKKGDSQTNRELKKILDQLKKDAPDKFNSGGVREQIRLELSNEGSGLSKALKDAGLDPKKLSPEDIMSKIESTGDTGLADLVKEMKKPKKEEGGGA